MNIFSKKSSLWLYVYQASNYVMPILVFPLMQHRLGSGVFTELIICMSFATIFTALVDNGFSSRGLKQLANEECEKRFLFSLGLRNKFISLVFMFPLLMVLFSCLYSFELRTEYIFWMVGILLWRVVNIDYLWHAEQNYFKLGLTNSGYRIGGLLVFVLFVRNIESLVYFSLYPMLFALLYLLYVKRSESIVFTINAVKGSRVFDTSYINSSLSNFISAISLNIPILAYSFLYSDSLGFIGLFVYFDKAAKAIRQLLKPVLLKLIPKYSGAILDKNALIEFLSPLVFKLTILYAISFLCLALIHSLIEERMVDGVSILMLAVFLLVIPLGLLNFALVYVFGLNNNQEKGVLIASMISLALVVVLLGFMGSLNVSSDLFMPVVAVSTEVFLCATLLYKFTRRFEVKSA